MTQPRAPACPRAGAFLRAERDYSLSRGRSTTRDGRFSGDIKRGAWVWGPSMKYALESVTLATFAVFLVWSVRIIAG
jgi:hypothetical protein